MRIDDHIIVKDNFFTKDLLQRANDVSKENIGFNSDYNEVTIHYNDLKKNKETLSHKKKSEISEEIVDRIVTHIN